MDNSDAHMDAMMLPNGLVLPAVLNAALELNLFEIISQSSSKSCMSSAEIASKLPTKNAEAPQRLDRMLFLLASHSMLSCSKQTDENGRVERLYGLTPSTKYFIEDNDGASYASLLNLWFHPTFMETLRNFKEVILDGGESLFQKVHGMPMFEYMETDPTLKVLFHKAMSDHSIIHVRQILETYKGFEGISTLVDVAGGNGQSLKMITSMYPAIRGVNFDLPYVIQQAPSSPGIEHVEGDMFKCVPEGDAIMLKMILHNWSDEKCIQILKNCNQSLNKGGKVIIIDHIKSEVAKATDVDRFIAMLDNVMFLFENAKERTEKEFEALCKGARFSSYKVACCVFSTIFVIEFYK